MSPVFHPRDEQSRLVMPFQSADICPAGGADIRGGHAPSYGRAAIADHLALMYGRMQRVRELVVVSARLNTADPILEREPPSSALGQIERLLPPGLSACYMIRQETFARRHGKGREAPRAAIPDRYPLSRLAARVQPLGSHCRT